MAAMKTTQATGTTWEILSRGRVSGSELLTGVVRYDPLVHHNRVVRWFMYLGAGKFLRPNLELFRSQADLDARMVKSVLLNEALGGLRPEIDLSSYLLVATAAAMFRGRCRSFGILNSHAFVRSITTNHGNPV